MRPNLFIIGAPKCGTTSLHAYLRTHPDVYMSDIKEPHYFCTDFPGLRRFPSEQNYLRLFEGAKPTDKYSGEATSRYLYSETAVKNILDFDPDAKLIAMLRNPVDLVHSLHAQLVYQFFEDETDFAKAWRLQDARLSGNNVPASCPEPKELQYGQVARLGQQVERLFDTVPQDNVHLVFFEDFKSHSQFAYSGVLDFLGLPDDERADFETANPHKRYRSGWMANLLFNPPPPLKQIKQGLKSAFGWQETAIGRWAYSKLTVPTKRERMSPALRQELTDYFADDIRLLERLTDRDLSSWRSPEPIRRAA